MNKTQQALLALNAACFGANLMAMFIGGLPKASALGAMLSMGVCVWIIARSTEKAA